MTADGVPSRARWRLPLLAVAGILPALLLAGFGFRALQREQGIALHEARAAAESQAAALAVSVRASLLEPALPSAADVLAFQAAPNSPDADPCLAAARAAGADAALILIEGTPFPALTPQNLPPGLEPRPVAAIDPDLAEAWHRAQIAPATTGDPGDAASRRQQWERLTARAAGTALEGSAWLRVGRALLDEGRTAEASRVFQKVLEDHPRALGETGMPLEVLALRGLAHVAEIDPSQQPAPPAASWWNLLAHRTLVRWGLPGSALLDVDPGHGPPVTAWAGLAARHEATRLQFHELGVLPDPGVPPAPAARWLAGTNGTPPGHLLSIHPVPGGAWWLLRSRESLRTRLQAALNRARLPAHLTAAVDIAGEELLPARPMIPGNTFAQATDAPPPRDFARVQASLVRPDVLVESHRARARGFGALVALAGLTAVAGFLAVLLAYERQRRLVELQADFTASVSHELRAPLAAVRLLAEELSDLPDSDAARRGEYHRLILRETRRLGMLVENVLRHARLERGGFRIDPVPVNLGDQLMASVESLQPTADERGIHLRALLPQDPVSASVDPQALQQVLVNLLDNALKHSPAGGTVRLGLERIPGPDPRARLWVADDGPGIPASDHERIFESYYRRGSELRRETAGVGLGLTIVRRLVDAHGGHVHLDSRPGAGARFTVELPVTTAPDAPTPR